MAQSIEVVVGVVGRAHGIRGDVAVDVRTDEPDLRFADGAVLRVENGRRTFTVDSSREHSGRLLVRFAELTDRTAAEAVRGTVLVVDVDPAAVPEDEDEYYDRQLVGLRARAADGTEIGPVVSVLHLPSQDTLEIKTREGMRLVPFVTAVVPRVDLAAGELHLADLPGLLTELDDDEDTTPAEPAPDQEADPAAEHPVGSPADQPAEAPSDQPVEAPADQPAERA